MANRFSVSWEPKQNNNWNYQAEYVFQEYPKWVSLADGSQILVHDKGEEDAAIGPAPSADSGDRDALMAEAKALGLNPHHKTGAEKLRELIAEAKG